MFTIRLRAHGLLVQVALAGLLVTVALPVSALYKVVAPDGRVTYTDRPPADTSSRVSTLDGGTVNDVTPPDTLPPDLRQTATRYPVVLYTAADCASCDAGRQLLVQRGIPYSEKRVASEEDAEVLERTLGTRMVPSLTIGSQTLRGLSADEWNAYLDAARYPNQSRLPRGWQPAATEPLVARRAARPAAAPAAPAPAARVREAPAARVREAPAAAPPTGLRF